MTEPAEPHQWWGIENRITGERGGCLAGWSSREPDVIPCGRPADDPIHVQRVGDHEHDPECALLYGDGPDAPFECECRHCCPRCAGLTVGGQESPAEVCGNCGDANPCAHWLCPHPQRGQRAEPDQPAEGLVWQPMPGDPRFEYAVDGRIVRWRGRAEPDQPDTAAIRSAYSVDDGWTLKRERVLALCDALDAARQFGVIASRTAGVEAERAEAAVRRAEDATRRWAHAVKANVHLLDRAEQAEAKLDAVRALHTRGNLASACDCFDGLEDCPTLAALDGGTDA